MVERATQQRAYRRVLYALIALLVLLGIGVVGYRVLEDMSFVDALYMTIITISTVGFQEVQSLSEVGRLFTVGLIFGGVGLVAYTLGTVAGFVMDGEWRVYWQNRRRQRMLAQLSDHAIVCGYGRVGRHVAHELKREGLPFVVIDSDPERVAHVRRNGYLVIQGNAANELYLKEAGIARARYLVAAVASDAENVFIVLTARGLKPDLLIAARANYEESESKLLRAGANRVIMPYVASGRRMVSTLLRPEVSDFLDEVMHSSELELLLEQITLAPASPLTGQTLAQAQVRSALGVTVLACKLPGANLVTSPDPGTSLQSGTRLFVLGTREQLHRLDQLASGSSPSP